MSAVSLTITDYSTEIPGALKKGSNIWEFPTITSLNKNKKKTFWIISVGLEDNLSIKKAYFNENLPLVNPAGELMTAWYKVDSGIVDMKTKKSEPTIVKTGKNIGKKNATNVFQQALRDALSKFNKQKNKATVDDDADGILMMPPMLAQVYNTDFNIPFPAYVQRKYDGLRAVAVNTENGIVLYSRQKKTFPISHLNDELEAIFKQYEKQTGNSSINKFYLDGELYIHGESLQMISGVAKNVKKDQTKLKYQIYDCFIIKDGKVDTTIFSDRHKILEKIINSTLKSISITETFKVANDKEIKTLYKQFIKEKYEGAMVRQDVEYEPSFNSYHSRSLLKIKPSLDAEFKLVGWEVGKGKMAGAVVLVCENEDGKRFNLNPALTIEERKEYAKRFETEFDKKFKGHYLIATFDDWSDDKIPLRARTSMEFRKGDDIYTI